ncbi:DivIVA domain-containing protein [Algoriphagus litoralis]|uniref:DivIVA domain-containing protein n=1 Tax=Algoriphagus litoralis TaxID=2202829 RepID=UPI000DBA5936|nr:DivIVA domain-containing protein [Algoriphagus litoralis]
MKISPTAIRQKAFETAFRGYEKKEVSMFLEEMSVAMEQINQENLELRSKLQQVESEAKRLKDVEDSLFRTLKTAEDTGASIITEATEAADQIIAEANAQAEETTLRANQYAEKTISGANQYAESTKNEVEKYAENVNKEANQIFQKAQKQAEDQARIITSAAEAKAKETIKEIRESMQSLVRSYDGLLEQREALVKSLKRLSQDALNQIDLSDAHFFRIDGKAYQRAIDELSRSSHFSVANIAVLATQAEVPADAESEEQFEEDMSTATLDEETLETVEAMTHELEEQGELTVKEIEQEQDEEDIAYEEEPIINESLPVVEDEVIAEEEIKEEEVKKEAPVQQAPSTAMEDSKPEDLKKSSGSFFDQFD